MVSSKEQKKIEDRRIERGTHVQKKCLTCQKVRLVEKGMFICDECKNSGIFSGLGG
jgi:ribosomal protein L37AE/L43A